MQQTFKKQEKLKTSKLISLLFAEGKNVTEFPIKLVYLPIEHSGTHKIQAGVSVPKRNFKKAVNRNRIKRLLREAYRKNKHYIYESEHTKKHIFMFIYLGKKEIEYKLVEEKMILILQKFLQKHNS